MERAAPDTTKKVKVNEKAQRRNTQNSEDGLSEEPKAQPPPLKHDFVVQRHASFLKVVPVKQ